MSAMDRRRFTGPESSQRLKRKGGDDDKKVKLTANVEREDGRETGAARKIFLQTGLITQASGSAYIETGKHKVLCAVHGPRPARRDAAFSAEASLDVEVRFAPFSISGLRRAPGKDTEAPHLASRLEQSLRPALRLDLLPKSAIDLVVYILENDSATEDVSAATTAASVALADAGVEMFGLVTACSALIAPPQTPSLIPTIVIDPSSDECKGKNMQAFITMACMPAMDTVTDLNVQGSVQPPVLKEAIKALRQLADEIHSVAIECLRSSQ